VSEERDDADDLGTADDRTALDDLLDLEPEEDSQAPEREDVAEGDQPRRAPDGGAQREREPRENRTIRAMRARMKQQEEDNRRLRANVDNLLATSRQPQPDPYRNAEAQRLEAERVAQMMPHEQAQYYAGQAEQRMTQQLMRARLEVGDTIDRQNFSAVQREEPLARRWGSQIEEMLGQARQQGSNPTREALYNQLLAQQVRDKTKRDGDRQRVAGRRAIARETTQPGGGRSTVAPARRNGAADDYDAVVDRLRNTRLGDVW
jgi:hypothetical protein